MHIGLVNLDQQERTIDLLCEINAYYNQIAPASRETVREHAIKNLLSQSAPHTIVVAQSEDGRILGLAAIAFAYSIVEPEPERHRQCQLKELFVSDGQRGRGIGRALMVWVAKYAKEHGCGRIDWPVKATNSKGISFYESLGAKLVEDRLSYRLVGSALNELVCSSKGTSGLV
jgi:GNAT superfamily N-acetyltransferase